MSAKLADLVVLYPFTWEVNLHDRSATFCHILPHPHLKLLLLAACSLVIAFSLELRGLPACLFSSAWGLRVCALKFLEPKPGLIQKAFSTIVSQTLGKTAALPFFAQSSNRILLRPSWGN